MSKHSAVSRARWQHAQRQTIEAWKGRNLATEREAASKRYLPHLQAYFDHLKDDARILEIGSGAICLSRDLPQKDKVFLDPLIDDFRRMFPGELPEGEYVAAQAEEMPLEDESFDLVLCLDTLNYSLNPELMLNEIKRVLKPDGVLLLSIRLHSQLEARLHYLAENWMPWLCRFTCPYYYSQKGILNTLKRHFEIKKEISLGATGFSIPGFQREEHLFVCSRKADKARA